VVCVHEPLRRRGVPDAAAAAATFGASAAWHILLLRLSRPELSADPHPPPLHSRHERFVLAYFVLQYTMSVLLRAQCEGRWRALLLLLLSAPLVAVPALEAAEPWLAVAAETVRSFIM